MHLLFLKDSGSCAQLSGLEGRTLAATLQARKGFPVAGARLWAVIQLVGIPADRGRLLSLLIKGKDLDVSVMCPPGFVSQLTVS